MPTINLQRKDLPFLLSGSGEVAVSTGELRLEQPIPENAPAVLSLSFKAGGNQKIPLGQDQTVKVALSVDAHVDLKPIFPSSPAAEAKLLAQNGLGDFFKHGANSDRLVLAFDVGASAEAAVTGSFAYSVLKAGVEVDAGADGGYTYLRALDKTLPMALAVPEFFRTMRLPEQVRLSASQDRAPEPGEAIALRYGGYLRLAAEASAGYRMAGCKSVSLGQLALSEKYDLSILGKVGLSAGIAGRFSILVTAAPGLPGWARVRVQRHRAKDMKIAADVNVGFKNQLDNLPSTADEFLSAALGVNAKNFLNVFQKAHELSDFDKFKQTIDGLARKYIGEFVGQGFDKLGSQPEFNKFLTRVTRVVTSYQQVKDRSVTLFDRYFDRQDVLAGFLVKVQVLDAKDLEGLRKSLTPEPFQMLSQLTDGDPLGFLLQQVTVGGVKVDSLAELKQRASAVLDLIRSPDHDELRSAIALSKQAFGIDLFFRELAKIDTPAELQALANQKIGLFVTRLVGRQLDSATNVKEAFKAVKAVLDKIDGFKNQLFDAFRQVVNNSYKVALHAEYSRASENDALVDAFINLGVENGVSLLEQAGKGDFEEILTTADTGLVRLQEGVLTHRARRESAFRVNIVGWHLNHQYEGFDRVITETEQRLVPSDQGITVLTTATLQVERQRKRDNEEMHVNFLLRALGESARAEKADPANLAFLIDTLKSLTARYQLSFTGADTSELELRDYLAFAKELGLDQRGANLAELGPLLPRAANGGFGSIQACYDVRFGEKALAALLSVKQLSKPAESAIRNSMRQMVLSNYLKSSALHDVAFAYATPEVYDTFDQEGFATFTNGSWRSFLVRLSSTVAAPAQVNLDQTERHILVTLFNIENSMVNAIKDLYKVLNSNQAIDPRKFEKRLGKFGHALNEFDNFDQTTNKGGIGTATIFAMFDMLVRLASGGDPNNIGVFRLTSVACGQKVEKLFMTDEASSEGRNAPAAAPPAMSQR